MSFSISADTAKLCRQVLVERFGESNPIIARELAELGAVIERLAPVTHYTLARSAEGWRIGARDGILVSPPRGKRGISEIERGLNLMEIVLAWPGDPVEVAAFLEPGRAFDDVRGSASVMVARVRQWVAEEIDDSLAELLKAIVIEPGEGVPAAVFRPTPGALPIHTGYDHP